MTILTLSALRLLFESTASSLGVADPRKLLGFTDNRQDAALQAGHFNDFVFLLTLRAGLIGALQQHGGILTEEQLAEAVFKALGFDGADEVTLVEYLRTPKLMGLARQEAQRTLRFIIGYRLLRDLRRGWRFNNPNLDQLGLLAIRYRSAERFCADNGAFAADSVLAGLEPQHRLALCQLVFDVLRRGLCLESRYLDAVEQDKTRTSAYACLSERWVFAPDERLQTARYLILTKRPDYQGRPRPDLLSGGPRSRLLRQIKNAEFWRNSAVATQVVGWKEDRWTELLEALLKFEQRQVIIIRLAGLDECERFVAHDVAAGHREPGQRITAVLDERDPGAKAQAQNGSCHGFEGGFLATRCAGQEAAQRLVADGGRAVGAGQRAEREPGVTFQGRQVLIEEQGSRHEEASGWRGRLRHDDLQSGSARWPRESSCHPSVGTATANNPKCASPDFLSCDRSERLCITRREREDVCGADRMGRQWAPWM